MRMHIIAPFFPEYWIFVKNNIYLFLAVQVVVAAQAFL